VIQKVSDLSNLDKINYFVNNWKEKEILKECKKTKDKSL